MSMGPLVSYRVGTWLIDECQIAFFMTCLMLRNLNPSFLLSFSLSFVLPSIICLVSWIPQIPVLCSPAGNKGRCLVFYCTLYVEASMRKTDLIWVPSPPPPAVTASEARLKFIGDLSLVECVTLDSHLCPDPILIVPRLFNDRNE